MRFHLLTPILMSLSGLVAAEVDPLIAPTDSLRAGSYAVQLHGALSHGGGESNGDLTHVEYSSDAQDIVLTAGAGFPHGLQILVSQSYNINDNVESSGKLVAGDLPLDTEQDAQGLRDVELEVSWLALAGKNDDLELLVRTRITIPTGNDDRGQSGIKVSNVSIQSEEEAGQGESAWRIAIGAALSRRFDALEPYVDLSVLFAAERDNDGVTEDLPSNVALSVGSTFHLEAGPIFDVRLGMNAVGAAEKEEAGVTTEAENYGYALLQATVWVPLGGTFTGFVSGSAIKIADHVIDDVNHQELENAGIITGAIGVQAIFGD